MTRRLISTLLLIFLAVDAFGTITHDVTSTPATCATCASLTFGATVNTGSNRLLAVSVGSRDSNAITGVTFNGTAMTEAVQLTNQTVSGIGCSVWYLTAPTQTTANVVVTAAGSNSSISAVAVSLFGVDQVNPLNDSGSNTASSATTVSIAGLTTSVNDAAIVDAMMTNNGPSVVSMQAETNRTQTALQNVGPSTDDQMGASRLINLATAGSPTLQWNLDAGGGQAALCAAAFAPASGGSNSITIFGKPQRAIQ